MSVKSFFKKIFVCGYWDIVVCDSLDQLNNENVLLVKSTLFEWYADPFVLTVDNKRIIFCERKKISKKNGDICTFVLNNNVNKKIVLIKEPFHLSFPNITRINDSLYIMPESSRGNSLRLYKYNQTRNKADFFKELKSNCSYVDSIFFENEQNSFIYAYDTKGELVLFRLLNDFSLKRIDSILDDSHTFRPAGNPHNGIFYFQDCSTLYGNSILARKNEHNSFINIDDNYVSSINAFCKAKGYSRYHTLNFDLNSQTFVFDVYREKINIFKPLLMVWRIICGNH